MYMRSQLYVNNHRKGVDRYGVPCIIWDAKRHLKPRKSYPYSSERQNTRLVRKLARELKRAEA